MSSSLPALGVSALALVLSPAPAFADAGDTITVTGRRVTEAAIRQVEKAPGGVDVVTAEDFADKLAISLRDTLAFSPGVYAQPRFGQEVRLSIRGSGISRGYHMRGLMLFQDGIPINLADNNGDFQEFDPAVFERIEVYRGGNALRFGGSTLGGAINAVTPKGRTAPGAELRLDGGSFGTIRGKAALGLAEDRGDAYLAVTSDRSDGDRDHARRDALRFNGNVGLRLSESVETRVYASVSHIDQDLPGALTRDQALATPRLSQPANVASDQERDIDSIRLQSRTTVDLGTGTLAFGGFLSEKQLFHPIYQVVDQKSVDYGAFARLDLAGNVAGLPLEASLGSTARFGHVRARQYVNLAGRRGALTADARQQARTIDSYAELRLKPLPSLSLIAGAVYTDGRREVDNDRNAARSGSADFDAVSPKIGILYEPAAGIQLYANYSRSVELPGFIELNQTPFAVSGVVAPGFVDVGAQKAWTVEIGTRGTAGIASWDVTLYRARVRGELLQFDQAPDVPAATFNADRTRHQGIEAGLDLRLMPWARLRQVYQLNDFRFRGDATFANNRLPVVPKQLYRADLRLGDDRLSLSPNLEWVPTGGWADYRNTTRAPGYTLLGIGAEATLRTGVTVFVDARNLTNRKAIGDISAAVLATPGAAIYFPVERRAVYGGVRARF
jgi:iron complex outermembrane receptor protein